MIYEMICRRCPFDAPTPLAVLMMHLNDPFPPLEPAPGLAAPDGLEDIIDRATRKDPEERYPDASALLEALRSLEADAPATSRESLAIGIGAEDTTPSEGDLDARGREETLVQAPSLQASIDAPPPRPDSAAPTPDVSDAPISSSDTLSETDEGEDGEFERAMLASSRRRKRIIFGLSAAAVLLSLVSASVMIFRGPDSSQGGDEVGGDEVAAVAVADDGEAASEDNAGGRAGETTTETTGPDGSELAGETEDAPIPTATASTDTDEPTGRIGRRSADNASADHDRGERGAPSGSSKKEEPDTSSSSSAASKEERETARDEPDAPAAKKTPSSTAGSDDKSPEKEDSDDTAREKDEKKSAPVRFDKIPRKW
jgi:hypothetical protein